MNYFILLFSFLFYSVAAIAQSATKETKLIDSQVFGKKRTLFVYTPANYAQDKEAKYQVIYVVAEEVGMLADLVASTSTYAASKQDFGTKQEFIIVGIQSEEPYRELLPKNIKKGTRVDLNPYLPDGQAELMDQHLEEEVFPFIQSNYQTYPYALLLGEGVGGTYALYDAAKKQPLFQSYISIIPHWMDYEQTILEKLTQKINNQAPAAYLFLATATPQGEDIPDRTALHQLEKALQESKNPSLHPHIYHQNNADGGSVLFITLGSSLAAYKKIVGTPNSEWLKKASQKENFTQAVQEYYQERDQWLGYTQPPRLDELVALATAVEIEFSKGIQLLDWGRELYPKSSYLYKKQADLSIASQQYQAAVEYYDKALELLEQQKESMTPRAYEFTYQLYQEAQARAIGLRNLKQDK